MFLAVVLIGRRSQPKARAGVGGITPSGASWEKRRRKALNQWAPGPAVGGFLEKWEPAPLRVPRIQGQANQKTKGAKWRNSQTGNEGGFITEKLKPGPFEGFIYICICFVCLRFSIYFPLSQPKKGAVPRTRNTHIPFWRTNPSSPLGRQPIATLNRKDSKKETKPLDGVP